ncbi:MAG: hypothetical protein, partial [Olavius algarvensis Gamma 3 endosymbiont]
DMQGLPARFSGARVRQRTIEPGGVEFATKLGQRFNLRSGSRLELLL